MIPDAKCAADILWHPISARPPFSAEIISGLAHTPFGTLHLVWSTDFLLRAEFEESDPRQVYSSSAQQLADLIVSYSPLPIRALAIGTPFQLQIWQALTRIPYATTASYQDIANAIHSPKSARAVGSAIGSNRLALLIPCHRVIRSDGRIGGFGWGIPTKEKILAHESTSPPIPTQSPNIICRGRDK